MYDEYRRRAWEPNDDLSPKQNEFATSMRIPLLSTAYPRSSYITGIVVCSDRDCPVEGIMPARHEICAVAEQLQRYCTIYRPAFRAAMSAFSPYDIGGGANLGYYRKRPDGGWCYRKRTWESPQWWPLDEAMPLADVLARNFTGWPST